MHCQANSFHGGKENVATGKWDDIAPHFIIFLLFFVWPAICLVALQRLKWKKNHLSVAVNLGLSLFRKRDLKKP